MPKAVVFIGGAALVTIITMAIVFRSTTLYGAIAGTPGAA